MNIYLRIASFVVVFGCLRKCCYLFDDWKSGTAHVGELLRVEDAHTRVLDVHTVVDRAFASDNNELVHEAEQVELALAQLFVLDRLAQKREQILVALEKGRQANGCKVMKAFVYASITRGHKKTTDVGFSRQNRPIV